jgi:hypothetical protein
MVQTLRMPRYWSVPTLIRLGASVWLLYFVHRETGIFTTACMGGILISIESVLFTIRVMMFGMVASSVVLLNTDTSDKINK